ncbi:uncharacterized protein LOC109503796 [Harpegnathos saltator]|uniref:uncharacterized protein LOC109503796 n=1 Tax=Harpegnathos saltator TaxID=610380 RepID=UPI000DBEF22F|nr:uncharacterized protein LOC109503796 [Harpegnathos saltator]
MSQLTPTLKSYNSSCYETEDARPSERTGTCRDEASSLTGGESFTSLIPLTYFSNLSLKPSANSVRRVVFIGDRGSSRVRFRRNDRITTALQLVLPCFATAICFRFLTSREARTVVFRPGIVWYWNANTNDFEKLEVLTLGNTAFCSVDAVNDLRGKTLRVGLQPIIPFIMRNKDRTGVTGFVGDMWTNLEEALGFKTIYRRVRRKYEETLVNGGAHALLITSAMYAHSTCHFDYSIPFTTSSYALFVQSEDKKASGTWYFDTFSGDLWLTTFIFTLCIACSIMGTYYVKKLICVNYTEFHDELSWPLFSLLYVLGGISGQGFQKIPRSWSLRLIILSCLLLGLLLSCGFSTTLTSDLTTRRISVPIANLEDVAIKRTHTLCVRNDSSAYIHFTVDESLEGEIEDDWKELVNHDCPDLTGNTNPAAELCDPSFVYLEAPNIFRSKFYEVLRNCSFVQLPETYWSRRLAFLHARSSQYRHLINMYILRMRTAGILNYLEKKWMSADIYSQSTYIRQSTFRPVEYEHINVVFCGFFTMIIVSAFICVLENVWYKLRLKYEGTDPAPALPRTRDNTSVNLKMRRQDTRSRPRAIVLSAEIAEDSEFLQSVAVRVNRW